MQQSFPQFGPYVVLTISKLPGVASLYVLVQRPSGLQTAACRPHNTKVHLVSKHAEALFTTLPTKLEISKTKFRL